jgi:ribonuclease HII
MRSRDIQTSLFNIQIVPEMDEPVDEWYGEHGYEMIAGVDEVGRGALAGPVVAGAVILGSYEFIGLNDSKLLTAEQREKLDVEIWANALGVGLAFLSPELIDEMNILQASLVAMQWAIDSLRITPDLALVDGNQVPVCEYPTVALVKGDRRSKAIMAASIVAKVARDNYMRKADRMYPMYGFESHKGYAAPIHKRALEVHGLCPIHRRSYAPCRDIIVLGQSKMGSSKLNDDSGNCDNESERAFGSQNSLGDEA